MQIQKFILCISLSFIPTLFAQAQEESLDLDAIAEVAPKPPPAASGPGKFMLMGRVDLTSETQGVNENAEHNLKNNHFLVFLKIKASPKTSFMGQIISEDTNNVFYFVEYQASKLVSAQFGKILIPFGDTRRFHYIYGGVVAAGVMLPNIWSATGFNLSWHLPVGTLDSYIVSSAEDGSVVNAPKVNQPVITKRQAGGLRYTLATDKKITMIFSGYQGSYRAGRGLDLNMFGVDIYSDYGAINLPVLKSMRFAAGFAQATFADRPNEGDIRQTGDYLELTARGVGPGETRVRYGTFIANDKVESVRDTNSLAVGYTMPVDVMRVLVEYQWNFEAVNEQDNDLLRVMASLDF